MDRAVEWIFALSVIVLLFGCTKRFVRTARLDPAVGKWSLWGALVLAWLSTYLLKCVQVSIESPSDVSLLTLALCRKVDDISFWAMLAGVGVGFVATEACAHVPISSNRRTVLTWIVLCVLSIAAYLYIVGVYNPANAGTFFWRAGKDTDPNREVIKLIQVTEGIVVVGFLMMVHLVHAIYLWELALRPCHTPLRSDAFRLGGLFAFVVFSFSLQPILYPLFDSCCKPILSSFGNAPAYTPQNVIAYTSAIGWPFALPPIVMLGRRIYCSIQSPTPSNAPELHAEQ